MGTLSAWHYPTIIAANQADHTYVTCGNGGKAWSCWGGKTGGALLRQGTGSTRRADRIAAPDERGGITCYLLNGVCHQAANRILLPAGITVRGARGYWVSEAVYGTYGRPRAAFGLCKAPFDQHPGITGDLPECTAAADPLSGPLDSRNQPPDEESDAMAAYLAEVTNLYGRTEASFTARAPSEEDLGAFQRRLFTTMVDFKLGAGFSDETPGESLLASQQQFEVERSRHEQLFEAEELSVDDFVQGYNQLIEAFQHEIANTLDETRYQELFELERGDAVALGDPEIAHEAFGESSAGV